MPTVCLLLDSGGQQCYYSDLDSIWRSLRSWGGGALLKPNTTLTYRGDKSTSKYQSHKIFPEVKKCSHVGFIRTVSRDLINVLRVVRVKQRLMEHVKERKSETSSTLLEFLEGCFCRMVDTISWKDVANIWSSPRNSSSVDI
jgi:hypothetical protein